MIFDRTSNSGVVKNPVYDRGRWYQYKLDADLIGDTPFYRTFADGLNMIILPPNMTVIDAKVALERQNIEGVGAEVGCTYGQIGYTTYADTNLSYPAVSLPDPDHMASIVISVFGYIDGDPLPVPQNANWTPIVNAGGGGGGESGIFWITLTPDGESVVSDKTFSEIYAAYNSGLLPVVYHEDAQVIMYLETISSVALDFFSIHTEFDAYGAVLGCLLSSVSFRSTDEINYNAASLTAS